MPDSTYSQLAQETTEEDPHASYAQFQQKAAEIRSGFRDFVRVNYKETGFLSAAQVAAQEQYVNQVLSARDPFSKEFQMLLDDYTGSFAESQKAETLDIFYNNVVTPLVNAKNSFAISKTSYNEWINWIRDESRSSTETKKSIATTLPDYLARRTKLAAKREGVLGDERFALLKESTDPKMKKLVNDIEDTTFFLESLSVEQREKLVTDTLNALPFIKAEEAKQFKLLEDALKGVVGKTITQDSMDRWTAKYKAATPAARDFFMKKLLPGNMERWKKAVDDREKFQKNPLFKELSSSDLSDIEKFKSFNTFLALHYDKKVDLLNRVDNALTAKKEGNEAWLSSVTTIISTAAAAEYVSSNRIGELVKHMKESGRTPAQVKELVKEWAKTKSKFNLMELKMSEGKVPQGMTRLSKGEFLMLKWEQRESYVNEGLRKLQVDQGEDIHSAFADVKGKVRHALDTEQWDEARMFLKQAWPMVETDADAIELRSMENYLKNFGQESEEGDIDDTQAMLSAVQKIDLAFSQLPTEVQPFYREALKKNAGCVRTIGVLLYNVHWCLVRGYLPRDLTQAEEFARQDTANRLEPAGPGHIDGAIEYNDVTGHGSAAIPENKWGPNVMCATSSEAQKVVQSANTNQNDFGYWYWGDLVVSGVSAGQYEQLGLVTRKQLTSAAYALQGMGETYYTAKEKLGLNVFSAN